MDLSNKTFSIFSLDKEIGGISKMIELSTLAMTSKVKNINIFLLKGTATYDLISNKFIKKKNVKIFQLSIIDKIYLKFGILKNTINTNLLNSDAIFIHNAKLAASFKKIYRIKPIILFFHTDKKKQLKMLKNVSSVFTVNNKTKELINDFYKEKKAYLLPNCININIKNKLRISKVQSKKIVVGAMGRLVKKKGFDLLIQVFKDYKNVELVIAGDGPLMKRYRKLIKNYSNIKLLGWIKKKDVFFSKIDIFCSPSKVEPFGLVILEAMARGIPVISTNCNGPIDIINNNINGILVNKNNINEIKPAIELLKNNADLRKKIIKNGLDTVKNKYTIDAYKKNIILLLTNTL